MMKTRLYLLDGGTLALDGFGLFWIRGSSELIRFAPYSLFAHPPGDPLCHSKAQDRY